MTDKGKEGIAGVIETLCLDLQSSKLMEEHIEELGIYCM